MTSPLWASVKLLADGFPVSTLQILTCKMHFIKALCLKVFTSMMMGASVSAETVLNDGVAVQFTPETTIGELLNHPAFEGFAERLLPRPEYRQQTALPLREAGALMPYHSLINAGDMAAGLNFLIRQARRQAPVFFEFYTADEQRADPRKAETGLFFFRGKPGAPFAIIAPGGGFSYVATLHEGLPLAQTIAEQGLNAFVLTYRTGQGERAATQDLARAIAFIFKHQKKLQVSRRAYSLWGASAGARMAAAIGSHGPDAFGGAVQERPCCVVMLYTGHADYVASEPATFVAVGERDRISPPQVMRQRADALAAVGTPVEFHEYSGVGHGFGLGKGSPAEGWIDNAIQFWRVWSHN